MPEGTSNSIVNLGELSKPADTLIKKVSKAVGGYFAPYQIKRVAKAEAEAALIKAQNEIQITDLHRRAMHRFVEEEAQRQNNIEEITAQALPQLKDEAKPDAMEDDWITNYFDKCRLISDTQMQELWSRVLAGEANAPGTYSKRTVNYLSDLDKSDADFFSKVCGFRWLVDGGGDVVLIFEATAEIYTKNGVNFNSLIHLDSIGLVQFDSETGFAVMDLPKKIVTSYFGKSCVLEFPDDKGNNLSVGKALLTKVGEELAPICGCKPVDGFWEYVQKRWKKFLPMEKIVPPPSGPAGAPT